MKRMDKEKVIKGLNQHCNGSIFDRCGEYPYYKFENEPFKCRDELLEDVFTLLKEPEAIESIDFGDKTEIMANLEDLTWDDWRMYHSDSEVQNIAKSAFDLLITLLKEQEPREPHYTDLVYHIDGTEMIVPHSECPRCIENGLAIWDAEIKKGQAYCNRCGQKVKWND